MNRAFDRLEKHYDKLTDLERFSLALAAELRGDSAEVRKLTETARVATYRMTAYPFAGMRDAMLVTCLVAAGDLLDAGGLLGWSYAIYKAREDEEAEGEAWARMQELAGRVLDRWDALPIFAQEIGLDVGAVLQFLPSRATIDLAVSMAQEFRALEDRILEARLERIPEAHRGALGAEATERIAANREAAAAAYAADLVKVFEATQE